uniref:RING-type E3 ubiquitin transferase n=1 Tax=Araucaria cunninghamii TaxID=56994 RepID=A0A0D6R5D4_ARACU
MGSAMSSTNSNLVSIPTGYPDAGIADSNPGPECEWQWQWQTDDLQWRSYSLDCSAAIEAARLAGRSSLEINVLPGSHRKHVIYLQSQPLRQVNLRTWKVRPVRRHIRGQSTIFVWEWWQEEKGQWHQYGSALSSKFEASWMKCTGNKRFEGPDFPAGLFFKINGQIYAMLFEADAVQCNVKTSSHRSVRRSACFSNQTSSVSDAYSNLNPKSNLAGYDSTLEIEWQWQTNDLQWRSYNPACSAAIEAAYADGQLSVYINLFEYASQTHLVHFKSQTLSQVNRATHRLRPVRRCVRGQTSIAIWEWWEEESSLWHKYSDYLTTKFEVSWNSCMASRTSHGVNCLAGVSFKLKGRRYSILFEADAIQCNVRTSFSRSVRRCAYFSNQSLHMLPVNMDHYPNSNETLQEQVIRNEHQSSTHHVLPEFVHGVNSDEDEECSVCLCSLHEGKIVELVKCHHLFHRKCIEEWFKTRSTCPQCLAVYDLITGNQPPGDMSVRYVCFTSQEAENGIEGYPGTDIIEITYRFPNGIQSAEHRTPGGTYIGATYIAYLPKNEEGEEILELLEIAWSRRLLFTVGPSLTFGQTDMVIWTNIHHKTQKNGGASNNGYPDDTYFARVKKELADVNIM